MFHVDPDELGSTERFCKADEKQRLVPDAAYVVTADRDELLDLGGGEGG